MLLILPVSYEFTTSLPPKKAIKKLNKDMVNYAPSASFFKIGKFMRTHKDETMFYGKFSSDRDFQIFHHMFKKRDRSSTGFYGTIEEHEGGSKISGKFRKPLYAYIFGGLWTVLILLLALILLALEEYIGCGLFVALWAVGVFMTFWDDKKRYLKAYFEEFPTIEES